MAKPLGTDVRVTLTYLAEVTFDQEEHYRNDDGSWDMVALKEMALHNVADNVRSATEYSDFDTEENFASILISEDDISEKNLMKMISYDLCESVKDPDVLAIDENGVLSCTEYDLHDWITSLLHTESMPEPLVGPDGETHFNAVTIKWLEANDGEPEVTPEDRAELEKAYDDLILAIVKLDSLHHDIAEYTC